MTTFNKPFVAKNGVEPGSNNTVDLGLSTNQFKNVYSNSVIVTGGLVNSTSTMVFANGFMDATELDSQPGAFYRVESAAYTVANNTLTFTRGDANTFDLQLTGVANTTATVNTSTTSASLVGNTVVFVRADSSTFDLDLNNLVDTVAISSTWHDTNNTLQIVSDNGDVFNSRIDTFQANVSISETARLNFGPEDDLSIFHDGSGATIHKSGNGNFDIISGGTVRFRNINDTESMVNMLSNGRVELFHNGTEVLQTNSGGIEILGQLTGQALNIDEPTLVTSNNRVGIGTTHPDGSLHITANNSHGGGGGSSQHTDVYIDASQMETPSGNARLFLKVKPDTNALWEFFAAGNDGAFGIYEGNTGFRALTITKEFAEFRFANSTSNTVMFHSNGNVGIGNTASTNKLTLNGTSLFQGNVTIENGDRLFFQAADGSVKTNIRKAPGGGTRFEYGDQALVFDAVENNSFEIRNSINVEQIIFSGLGQDNPYLRFTEPEIANSASDTFYSREFIEFDGQDFYISNASANVVTFASNGNVGIGTTTPARPLTITGPVAGIQLNENDASGVYGIVSQGGNLFIQDDTDSNPQIQFNRSASYIAGVASGGYFFSNNSANNVTFASNGNVGIGTIAPSRKLEVIGSESPVEIRVANDNVNMTNHSSALVLRNTDTTDDTYFNIVFRDGNGGAASDITTKFTSQSSNYGDVFIHTRQSDGYLKRFSIESNDIKFSNIDSVDVDGNLTVTGDFTVSGTTTTVDTSNVLVEDPVLLLGKNNNTAITDIGFLGQRYDDPTPTNYNVAFIWDESADAFRTMKTNTDANTSTIVPLSQANLVTGSLHVSNSTGGYTETTFISQSDSGTSHRLNTTSGFISIGPQNSSFAHITTDRNQFYFNRPLILDGDSGAFDGIKSYNANLVLESSYTGDTDNNHIEFKTGAGGALGQGTTKAMVAANGFVGIGTTSPEGLLHLSSSSGNTRLYIQADSDNNEESDHPQIIFQMDGTVETGAIWTGNYNGGGSNDNALNLAVSSGFGASGIRFHTESTGNNWENSTQRMLIAMDGKVGIGNNDPQQALVVGGSIVQINPTGDINATSSLQLNGGRAQVGYNGTDDPIGDVAFLQASASKHVKISANSGNKFAYLMANGAFTVNDINPIDSVVFFQQEDSLSNEHVLRLAAANNKATGIRLDLDYNVGSPFANNISEIMFDFYGDLYSGENQTGSHGLNIVSGRPGFANFYFRDDTRDVKMMIDDAGNTGIGFFHSSSKPTAKLDVQGDIIADALSSTAAGLTVFPSSGRTSNYSMRLLPGAGAGAYGALTSAGDHLFLFSNGTQGQGNLVIAPWSSYTGGHGIKIVGNTFHTQISGNTFAVSNGTVNNAFFAANGNIGFAGNDAPVDIISVGTGSGSDFISFNTNQARFGSHSDGGLLQANQLLVIANAYSTSTELSNVNIYSKHVYFSNATHFDGDILANGVISFANSASNNYITATMLDENTLSFDGDNGQLFSISDDFSGSLFSVNDISGIPSIEVHSNGQIDMAPYGGNVMFDSNTFVVDTFNNRVGIGTSTPTVALDVKGGAFFEPVGTGNGVFLTANYPESAGQSDFIIKGIAGGDFFIGVDGTTGVGGANNGILIYDGPAGGVEIRMNSTISFKTNSTGVQIKDAAAGTGQDDSTITFSNTTANMVTINSNTGDITFTGVLTGDGSGLSGVSGGGGGASLPDSIDMNNEGDHANAAGTNAIAIGAFANAAGGNSIAIGLLSQAVGEQDIVIGMNAYANSNGGKGNIAIGAGANAHMSIGFGGGTSIAIGNGALANAISGSSVAIGGQNPDNAINTADITSAGRMATALGGGVLANNFSVGVGSDLVVGNPSGNLYRGSIAIGLRSTASEKAIAIGTSVEAFDGIAIGSDSKATHPNSAAIGRFAQSQNENVITLGSMTHSVGIPSGRLYVGNTGIDDAAANSFYDIVLNPADKRIYINKSVIVFNDAGDPTSTNLDWLGANDTGSFGSSGSYVFGHDRDVDLTTGSGNSTLDAGNIRMNVASANNFINGSLGIGTSSPSHKLEVNGSFAATTKSFVIDHPTKKGMKLKYGSLEGPENGVYVRGRLKGTDTIELPDYWVGLVDEDSITVQLTPIGSSSSLYIKDIIANKVIVGNEYFSDDGKSINCFYLVQAERKDVEKLVVELEE